MIPKPYNLKPRKAFALILVLLFTAISLMVITSIALGLASGAKLNRNMKNTEEAYSLARAGIQQGLITLQTSPEKNPFSPAGACSATDTKFDLYISSSQATPNQSDKKLSEIVSHIKLNAGDYYAFSLCAKTGTNNITAIGFSGGQKITLKAVVKHDDKFTINFEYDDTTTNPITLSPEITRRTGICGTDAGLNQCASNMKSLPGYSGITIWNHSKDLIKIYQAGL